jgi:hypothetical protein
VHNSVINRKDVATLSMKHDRPDGCAVPVVLVAETTGALVVPCAQIGWYVCVAAPEFGMQTDPLMPPSARTGDVRDFG